MTLTVPTIESTPTFDAQAWIDSTDLNSLQQAEVGTGVIAGMQVTPSSGLTVAVAAGIYAVNGTLYGYAGGTFATTNGTTTDRRDLLTINASGTIAQTQGTQCGTSGWTRSSSGLPPVKPSIPASTCLLAELYFQSGTSTVATGNIIDKTTPVHGGQINQQSGKNWLLNGAMDVNQRNSATYTAVASTTTYTLDRWCYFSGGTNLTIGQVTSGGPTGLPYYAAIKATSTTSNTWSFAQSLETPDVVNLQGKIVTLSFWYKLPVNFTNAVQVSLRYSTGTNANLINGAGSAATAYVGTNVATANGSITANTAWTLAQVTFLVPTTATSLCVQFQSTSNIVATGEFDVTGVMLEMAGSASSFVRRALTFGDELRQCQRYYVQWTNQTAATQVLSIVSANSTTAWFGNLLLPVPMRGQPALTQSGQFAIADTINATINTTVVLQAATSEGYTQSGYTSVWLAGVVTGATAFRPYFLITAASTTAFLGLAAEL